MGRSESIIQMDWDYYKGADKLNRLWTQIAEMNVNLRPTSRSVSPCRKAKCDLGTSINIKPLRMQQRIGLDNDVTL